MVPADHTLNAENGIFLEDREMDARNKPAFDTLRLAPLIVL